MLRFAALTHDHDNHASGVRGHLPVQHGVGQDIAVNHRFPSVFDCPCRTGGRFGVRPFVTSFRSGRHSSSLATRRADLASSSLVRSARLFNHVCDHFPKRAHRAGARTLLGNPFFQRQHVHPASNLCRAALHRNDLSSSLTCWMNKYQQCEEMNWISFPKKTRTL